MKTNPPQIVWFKSDLRLTDNPAWHAAAATGSPLIALYILDDEVSGEWKLGRAARWWLYHSLKALSLELEAIGGRLLLRRGSAIAIIQQVITDTGANVAYWNRGYELYNRNQEALLTDLLRKNHIEAKNFNGALLFEPNEIMNKQWGYYKVFTQYWNTCLKDAEPPMPLPKPSKVLFYSRSLPSDKLENWKLVPNSTDWTEGLSKHWRPGEAGALASLQVFLKEKLADYSYKRDLPFESDTSQLSPHLKFGEISPRTIWSAIFQNGMFKRDAATKYSSERFLAELGWREFSYYLLYHFPELPQKNFNSRFNEFSWHGDDLLFDAWKTGLTGYPIVDAGMRQLLDTGWMHNRLRMITASFLTKDLLIPWQWGAKWFWEALVDADLANNSASWQWVAGCGADAAPYFRIFNPVLQGKKFDPDGIYIKRWVPELKDLPKKYLHCPWEAPLPLLASCDIELGQTYPFPIVDHADARKMALEAFSKLKVNK